MYSFSSDRDVLKYEPSLFGDLAMGNQLLSQGHNAHLNGVTFTAAGQDFESSGITAGMVICAQGSDGVLDGAFEIVSVDSETQLTELMTF